MPTLYRHTNRHAHTWLERGSHYFKIDLLYLARGGFWLSIGKAGGVIASLILAVAFANLLPQTEFGIYQFVLSIASIVSAFTLTGMGTSVVQAVSRGYEGMLKTAVATKLTWSITIALISFAGAGYYYVNENMTLAAALLIVGTFSPFLESFKLYNSYLVGTRRFKESTMLGFWRKPLPLIAILGTLALTDNPVLLVLAYFASHTASVALVYWKVIEVYNPSGSVNKEALSYGKHLSVTRVVGRIAGNIDKILLFHFLGAAPLAVYAFAANIPKQLQSLLSVFQPLVLPKLSNRSIEELKVTLPRKALLAFLILLVPVCAYIVSAPYLYHTFFPQYIESIRFSQIFSLAILFLPASLFENALHAHLKKREMYIITTSIPVFRIVLLIILTPLYGLWGVIASMLATQVLYSISLLILFRRL